MISTGTRRLAGVLAALLMLGAGLLVVGIIVERAGAEDGPTSSAESAPHDGPGLHNQATQQNESGEHSEIAEQHEATGHDPATASRPAAEPGHSTTGSAPEQAADQEPALARLLESPVLVGAVVAASFGLAVAVWRRPIRPVLAVTAAFAAAALGLDITEVSHQFSAGQVGIALLAMLIAATRVGVLALTILLWRRTPSLRP